MQRPRNHIPFAGLFHSIHLVILSFKLLWLINPLVKPYFTFDEAPISSNMDQKGFQEAEKEDENYYFLPRAAWFTKIISFQADMIYNCIMTLLSPFLAFFSTANESYRRTGAATAAMESAVLKVPYKVTYGSLSLMKRVWLGIVGVMHVFVVLSLVMVLSVVLGVGLVRLWVEEPVVVREKLFFDYTEVNPSAVFGFDGSKRSGRVGVPVGHTFYVSVVLLMPESDHNRNIGIFQFTAEVLTTNGTVMAKSSQPCMLRYRSFPVRLFRTFLMGMPLILGICEETQQISIQLVQHRENSYRRTKAIRMTLIPRAGTSFLPQLYETEILVKSQLPWKRQIVRNWRWTCYVWASIYTFILLLLILLSCCRPLLFPIPTVGRGNGINDRETSTKDQWKEPSEIRIRDEEQLSEMVRQWREKRRKRKAAIMEGDVGETAGSSASSITFSREEETADSESVCFNE